MIGIFVRVQQDKRYPWIGYVIQENGAGNGPGSPMLQAMALSANREVTQRERTAGCTNKRKARSRMGYRLTISAATRCVLIQTIWSQ